MSLTNIQLFMKYLLSEAGSLHEYAPLLRSKTKGQWYKGILKVE